MKSRYIILAAAAALVPALLGAQSRDHVVVVSNTYEVSAGSVRKPMLKMEVPDSLLRFDLDYDYSVRDNPYKGSYEFSPKQYTVTPDKDFAELHKLYLSAGAGYSLHPEAAFAWTGSADALSYGVRGSHNSYFGDYHVIGLDPDGNETYLRKTGNYYKNFFSMANSLEGHIRHEGTSAVTSARLFYDGVMYEDKVFDRNSFNSFGASASYGASSRDIPFYYEAAAAYRYSADKADPAIGTRSEHWFNLGGSFGPSFSESTLLVDINMELSSQRDGEFSGTGGLLSFTPHFDFDADRWSFSLGVRVDALIGGENYTSRRRMPYPAVRISYELVPSLLDAYFTAGGGADINAYFRQVAANKYCNSSSTFTLSSSDFSFTPVNVAVGLRGRAGGSFQYDVKAGYSRHENSLLDGVDLSSMIPMISFVDYNKVYAEAKAAYIDDVFEADGNLRYAWTDAASDEVTVLAPAAFSGDISTMYRFTPKFSGGISLAFTTSRRSGEWSGYDAVVLPGWVDLGLKCRYAVSDRLSVWGKGGNLAGMTIQRNPLYAEKGPFVTAGVSFVL